MAVGTRRTATNGRTGSPTPPAVGGGTISASIAGTRSAALDTLSAAGDDPNTASIAPVAPPPKNVDRLISEYIDRYTKDLFLTTNLL